MPWDFSTEPEFEKELDWIRGFVREEVEPLEVVFPGCEFLPLNDERRRIVDPLKQRVRDEGLWAPHLGPELGGQGFGAVKLTLINEILGRSPWAPIVFGTQAPRHPTPATRRSLRGLAPRIKRTATCRACCPARSSPASP
ncbi:hypothetical protein YM3MPS_01950 [Mycobacterium pseudoshottsii]|uniref:Acyl-CoA dehydrogenase/oxidase N-terminal domain-containing protein n=1 Tax=Mycobacterium pseudoshottsii TaxID=265949 RepID=A0A9N7LIM1_9MYCO|nr:Butyryl-CoA dehydrogenase [Mycobacterium sp. 012931]BDN79977.1 hypothetical protein NJB1907Z4_C01920 [Mycobacterium pseudoshottsii]BEH74392.1 hypothetical protein YM3MPS_01950 [Mycobacterium pseudoshottsii]